MRGKRTALRTAAILSLSTTSLLLAGCMTTRPRISELYPEPAQQMPSVTTSETTTRTETSTQVYTTPGTTLYYDDGEDRQNSHYREPYWDRDYYRRYPDRRPVYREREPAYEKVGKARYYYPEGEVRCDNATGSCARWSGRQGRYVPDAPATQEVYGVRQRQRIHGDVPQRSNSSKSND